MTCAKYCALWWLLPCLLLAGAGTSWAQTVEQPASPQSVLNLPTPDTTQTDPWSSFDESWETLKGELTEWAEDSQRLSALLEALQIEADGLRSSLEQSTRLYGQSEAARMTERELAQSTIRLWKIATIVTGIFALCGWLF